MKAQLVVLDPIYKSTRIGANGTEKLTVRLQVPAGGAKTDVPGVELRPGSEMVINITDPALFNIFKPGAAVSIDITAAS